jgi:hypothetical protein
MRRYLELRLYFFVGGSSGLLVHHYGAAAVSFAEEDDLDSQIVAMNQIRARTIAKYEGTNDTYRYRLE